MKQKIFFKTYDFDGDAADIFRIFSEKPFVFFLDSSLVKNERSHFSFIGFGPFDVFSSNSKESLDQLSERFYKYRASFEDSPVPFFSGIVGFLGYEFGFHIENSSSRLKEGMSLPNCFFGFYDNVIAVDHLRNKLYIISTGLSVENDNLREQKSHDWIESISQHLERRKGVYDENILAKNYEEPSKEVCLLSNFTREDYLGAIHRCLEHIREGDIYQINLTQRFLCKGDFFDKTKLRDLYLSLRKASPSSFSCYFDAKDFQIISSSPEQFLEKRENHIITCPMKGTRPRSNDIFEDEEFKTDLLFSAKEKAELLMVTDLERNDLGKVCENGSVRVQSMRTLEEYKTVFHTTSTVEGILREDKNVFDLLKACFPSGSVTGCPKIRAMQIIDELEPNKREAYTGCLGYIGFDETMDFNILIRTLICKDDSISFHVGGGIVADSVAEDEYDETLIKAKALRQSINRIFSSKEKASI